MAKTSTPKPHVTLDMLGAACPGPMIGARRVLDELLALDEATERLAPLLRAEIWSCPARPKHEGEAIIVIDTSIPGGRETLRASGTNQPT